MACPFLNPPFQHLHFFGEERVKVVVVGADGAAENHEQMGFGDCRFGQIVHACIAIGNGIAPIQQHRAEATEILKSNMPNGDDGLFHFVSLFLPQNCTANEPAHK